MKISGPLNRTDWNPSHRFCIKIIIVFSDHTYFYFAGEKPNPVTIRTFKHLMRLYTNEDQYTSVFDIEYLNTEEKMVEELQRRKHYECYLTAKFKCQKCYLVFYKPKHLENHIKMHEVGPRDVFHS